MTELYIFLWWLSGFLSFCFWWTKDFDLGAEELFVGVVAGIIGPISFILGAALHSDFKHMVIIRKRKK